MSVSVPAALELRDVVAAYGGLTVLRGVSVAVPTSGVVALLGPNGAGKTTLLRIAPGLLEATSGSVHLHGDDVTTQPRSNAARGGSATSRKAGASFPSLTVRDNLRAFTTRADASAAIDSAIAAFPVLGERIQQIAGTMSGGQQQMLALARAWMASPRLALIDEPTLVHRPDGGRRGVRLPRQVLS